MKTNSFYGGGATQIHEREHVVIQRGALKDSSPSLPLPSHVTTGDPLLSQPQVPPLFLPVSTVQVKSFGQCLVLGCCSINTGLIMMMMVIVVMMTMLIVMIMMVVMTKEKKL